MEFPERLTDLRKERGVTQQSVTDQVELSVLQIRAVREVRKPLRVEATAGGVQRSAVSPASRLKL